MGTCQPAAVRRFTKAGALSCQMTWMVLRKVEVGLWSTHIICLSALVCSPENVVSNSQVPPPSVDLYARIWRTGGSALMPMVVAQAVPSEVQSTVGSECRESL